MRIDPRKMIARDMDRATAIGLVRRDQETDVKFAFARKLEGEVNQSFISCTVVVPARH